MRMNTASFRITSLFILSLVMIAYELSVMRVFSVGSWSNFGSMVISIALLGYGLSGTLLTFFEKKLLKNADAWLFGSSFLLGPSMVFAHILAQKVPFNPVMITMDPKQYLWIAAYYALYAVPYFVGATFIGTCFTAYSKQIYKLYFWDMLGAGLGGFLILGLMYLLPPNRLLGPLVVIATLSSFFCIVDRDEASGEWRIGSWKMSAGGGVLAVSILCLLVAGDIKVSEFKPISYARQFPDVKHVYHDYGPLGEFDAFKSSYFHFAPGLSDNASSNIAVMPTDAFLGLYIDGDGPIGIMRKLRKAEEPYLDYLPMAAPYLLMKDPKVLLLKLGGGIGAYGSLYHGAREVTVVESNHSLVRMLKDVPYFRSYTGDFLRDPRVTLVNTEPRAFTSGTKNRFDLVEIGLVDSVGLSTTGGYPVHENYLYTAEGLASYLSCLSDAGILSVTVWNRLTPPRNVPKLLTTVVEALKERKVAEPEKQIFAFDLLLSTATVLVKNSPFTQAEIDKLLAFCKKMSFAPCYYPGMPKPERAFEDILAGYRGLLEGKPLDMELLPHELYYYTLSSLFQGKAAALYDGYIFNIKPVTDDRPYYTAYVKPSTISLILKDIKDVSEEWGYILLVATFGVSIVFGAFIILLPVGVRWKDLFKREKGRARIILYFACLGIGYMLVEIFLLQRLSFFLVDPIFANSVVITCMLIITGVGSIMSGIIPLPKKILLRYAVAGIALSMLFYIFGLSSLLDALLGQPLWIKILLSILFIAPSAFCLGMPFPTGLSMLSAKKPGLIPWAWGVNGSLSVTGAVLARLASISLGFSVVLLGSILLYVVALFAYSGIEAE